MLGLAHREAGGARLCGVAQVLSLPAATTLSPPHAKLPNLVPTLFHKCQMSEPGYTVRPRGCGGIGRRARFRSVWAKARGGSSPLIRIRRFRHSREHSGNKRSGGAVARIFQKRGMTATVRVTAHAEAVVVKTPGLQVHAFRLAFGRLRAAIDAAHGDDV
jgi:hypothetical protein